MRAGLLLMIIMVLAGIGFGSASRAAERVDHASENEPVIHIVARRYRFEPDHIVLQAGVPVVLELSSPEVLMSFNAPDFMISEALAPGDTVKLRLIPSRTGEFIFVCDIYCGSGHAKMKGLVSVQGP
jgi:cytochrome c oxidase subunit 2